MLVTLARAIFLESSTWKLVFLQGDIAVPTGGQSPSRLLKNRVGDQLFSPGGTIEGSLARSAWEKKPKTALSR
jgi:hypothetical protein